MAEISPITTFGQLIGASAAVVGETDLQNVLRRLVTEARAITGARYAALGVIGPHGVLVDFIHDGMDKATADKIGSLPRGRGVLGTVVKDRETIALDDVSQHPDSFGFPPHHPPMENFLGVPVIAGSNAFGNLYLTEKPGGFGEDDIATVEALAKVAGSAINTARMHNRLEQLAVVQDRDRIARDLHDSIIQELFAIGLGLQTIADRVKDGQSASILNESVDSLDGVVEELRAYIYDLRRRDDITFQDRLMTTIDRLRSAYPADVSVSIEDITVPSDLSHQVDLILTEALSNALRHSDASVVIVRVQIRDAQLWVTVEDEGIGFDRSTVKSGMGLRSIEDRSNQLGGSATVRSDPGEGTKVEIRLPLN